MTSDTSIRAYRSLRNFRGESSFYLHRICLNQGSNFAKRRKDKGVQYIETLKGPSLPSGDGPLEQHRLRTLKEAMENALLKLSPRERAVFVLRQYEDLTIKEVCESLNLKERTG